MRIIVSLWVKIPLCDRGFQSWEDWQNGPVLVLDGHVKNPTKYIWRLDPGRGSNFFSTPANWYAVTYLTEIPLPVIYNHLKLTSSLAKVPIRFPPLPLGGFRQDFKCSANMRLTSSASWGHWWCTNSLGYVNGAQVGHMTKYWPLINHTVPKYLMQAMSAAK